MPLVLLTSSVAHARQFEGNSSVVVRGSYITSSKLFFNPDAATSDLRSQYVTIDDMLGAGFELRWRIQDANVLLTFSGDYISKTQHETQLLFNRGAWIRLPVSEGILFIPMEVGVNTYVPLGSQDLKLTMGGGVGAYYALRTLTVAGVGIRISNTPVGYGIYVSTGFEYRLGSLLGLRFEMKFRDPEVVNETSFDQASTNYDGKDIEFRQDPFRTKIQVDGLSLSFGLMMELF